MASAKRNFADIDSYEGKLEGNIYKYPTLYNRDSRGRTHIWNIYMRLILAPPNPRKYEQNWKCDDDIIVNPKNYKSRLGNSDDVGIQGQVWTEQGIEGMSISRYIPTLITEGKNIGKRNETSIFTQSLIVANGLYEKKKDKGGVKNKAQLEVKSQSGRIPPMALHKFKDHGHKYIIPGLDNGIYVQPKLDGVRAIAHIVDDEVDLYSRGNKNYNHIKHLIRGLKRILKRYPTMYLDGEIYGDGLSMQEISGIARGDKEYHNINQIKFYVFDIYFKDEPKMIFVDRLKQMQALFKKKVVIDVGVLIEVETKKINSLRQLDKYYQKKLVEGYEGVVLRHSDGLYETDPNHFKERRSYHALKYKPRESKEYKIVNFASGTRGKEKGAIKFVVEIPATKDYPRSELTLTPNMPLEKRYKMYEEALQNFKVIYEGKMATVDYDKLSDKGIPLDAKLITIRDYE